MENASKALIIAGAILLSILIIALGIYVFNMAKGATNTNQLDAVQVSAFNDVFTNYDGKQIGTSVKQLIGQVISNASQNEGASEKLPDIKYVDTAKKGKKINLGSTSVGKGGNPEATICSDVDSLNTNVFSTLRSNISASHYYQVTFDYDIATGLVNLITIKY